MSARFDPSTTPPPPVDIAIAHALIRLQGRHAIMPVVPAMTVIYPCLQKTLLAELLLGKYKLSDRFVSPRTRPRRYYIQVPLLGKAGAMHYNMSRIGFFKSEAGGSHDRVH
ncbi:hypothetical protein M404DRAFT_17780 [Pisolithus tinctorius Marx 270]|uniref:Uncharacterized protein n=1 Tax=Pisolithus tinctorius Marx 270 TaxID=870435 RepID=A0A0C3PYY2_PISTI|nr:hypothetical protein M404DRAFT_17780 [Pisolithus tinctorius Marx 270]